MELQKGMCFLCHNNKVITPFRAETGFDIICSLFSKKTLNIEELNKIQTLKFCPICYHKLIILKGTSDNIQDEGASGKCVLCKSGKVLFKIDNWSVFNKISEDLVSKDEDACYIACSDCLFYLNTRQEIKSKLISKYPRLRLKSTNGNENKRKLKNNLNVPSQSTVAQKKESIQAIKILQFFRNSGGSRRQDTFSVNFINELKPLKDTETFRKQEIIKSDYMLLNQVPCVLLPPLKLSNEHCNKNALNKTDDPEVSYKMAQKKETGEKNWKSYSASADFPMIRSTLNKPIKHKHLYTKLKKLPTEMSEQHIVKDLIVKLPKMNILQKQKAKSRNYKHDPEIENLIDKFNVLQRPTTANSSKIVEEHSKNDFIDLTQDTSDVKIKRKSVSFAEDKNVEIQSVQDDFTIGCNNDQYEKLTNNPVKANLKNRRRSKIAKELDTTEDIVNSDVKTKLTEADENVIKKGSPSEDDKSSSDNENDDVDNEKMVMNDDKDVYPHADSEETEKEHIESKAEKEVGKIEVKKQSEKKKPGPLSKKKGDGSADKSTKNVSSENDKKDETFKNVDENIVDDKQTAATEDNDVAIENKSRIGEDLAESSDAEQNAQEHEETRAEKEVEEMDVEKKLKREEPKPLSKEKGNNSANKSSQNLNSEETISPKPLSKKEEVDGSDTVTDNSDQTKDNEDCVLSNEQEQFCKKTELDSDIATDTHNDNVDNSVTNDENHAHKATESEETDNSKKNDKGKSALQINNENSTNDILEFATKDGKESNSEGALLEDDNENKCISGREEDEEDDLMIKNKSDPSEETSKETVQLNVLIEENTKCSNSDDVIDPNLNDENKESEEEPTGGDKTGDSSKKIENFDSNSFSGSDKNIDDDDDDTQNINSILTGMFSPEEECGDERLNEWKIIEKDTDDKTNHKRKIVDELNNSSDKKKKKVTFCEDFT